MSNCKHKMNLKKGEIKSFGFLVVVIFLFSLFALSSVSGELAALREDTETELAVSEDSEETIREKEPSKQDAEKEEEETNSEFSIRSEEQLLQSGTEVSVRLPILDCDAQNLATSIDDFNAVCNPENGSALLEDDGITEDKEYGRAGGGASRYGGVRTNSSNSSITDCYNITKVELCYEWWRSTTAGTTTCSISVDADHGASYSSVSTTCPETDANPGVTCADVTSLESWTCDHFFGGNTTGALARSQLYTSGVGGAQTYTAYWDLLRFNVTYEPTTPSVNLIGPANNSTDSNGIVNFRYSLDGNVSSIENCSLVIDDEIFETHIPKEKGANSIRIDNVSSGTKNWKISCTDSLYTYVNSSEYLLNVIVAGGGNIFSLENKVIADKQNDTSKVSILFKDQFLKEVDKIMNFTDENIDVREGFYFLEIEFNNSKVEFISVDNATLLGTSSLFFKIQEDVDSGSLENIVKTYAIDPQINYSHANVTATASGHSLLKCSDWEWEAETCSGTWETVMGLTPGQQYTFTITPDDPALAEEELQSVGSGSPEDPYQISNCTGLQNIQDNLTAHYVLINDIDCSDTVNWNAGDGFDPIGDGTNGLTGTLEGDKYTIYNLTINIFKFLKVELI